MKDGNCNSSFQSKTFADFMNPNDEYTSSTLGFAWLRKNVTREINPKLKYQHY